MGPFDEVFLNQVVGLFLLTLEDQLSNLLEMLFRLRTVVRMG